MNSAEREPLLATTAATQHALVKMANCSPPRKYAAFAENSHLKSWLAHCEVSNTKTESCKRFARLLDGIESK